jgi:hypothetical protein
MERVKQSGQKNFRIVPAHVAQTVAEMQGRDIVVACTRALRLTDIVGGEFAHVGIEWTNDRVTFQGSVIPLPEAGKYSTRNVEGHVIVRRDLPMVTKTFSAETPNFGDWSLGSHEVSWDRSVYQRENEAPKLWEIAVELLREDNDDEEPRHVFKFQVNAVLRPGSDGFDADLLYALNLLQENVGAVGIFPADSTREDYLKTVTVGWEILPPGERDEIIVKMLGGMRNPSDEAKQRIAERYDVLAWLKPTAYIAGTSGFQRYFGAKFAEDLVVFENLEYGNAIYVMFEDWQQLSRQSRIQLLQGGDGKFVRIIHAQGWQAELRRIVQERLGKVDGYRK